MANWAPVGDWPYEVSDEGDVRRIDWRDNYRASPVLKPSLLGDGYAMVTLSSGDRRRTARVHRLVLEAFVGPCPPDHECNHKDSDRANNRMENLEWVTHGQNLSHAFASGLKSAQGENNPGAKLTEECAIEVYRRSHVAGETHLTIARDFHISPSTVKKIKCGERWSHATGAEDNDHWSRQRPTI